MSVSFTGIKATRKRLKFHAVAVKRGCSLRINMKKKLTNYDYTEIYRNGFSRQAVNLGGDPGRQIRQPNSSN